MSDARPLVAFWLVPAEPARSAFARVVSELAAHHDAPGFMPHVTLFAGTANLGPGPQFSREIEQVVQGLAAFSLRVTGVGHGERRFKTLFLQIAPNAALRTLERRIHQTLRDPDDYPLEPHLSLLYKTLPEATRERIASEVRAPESFVCDTVCVVVPGPAGWSSVDEWKVLHSRALGDARTAAD